MKKMLNSLRIQNENGINELLTDINKITMSIDSEQLNCSRAQIIDTLVTTKVTHISFNSPTLTTQLIFDHSLLEALTKCPTLTSIEIIDHNSSWINQDQILLFCLNPHLKFLTINSLDDMSPHWIKALSQSKSIETVSFQPSIECIIEDFQAFLSIPTLKELSYSDFIIDNHRGSAELHTAPQIVLIDALRNNPNLVIKDAKQHPHLKPMALEQYATNLQQELTNILHPEALIDIIASYLDFDAPECFDFLSGQAPAIQRAEFNIIDPKSTPIIGEDEYKEGDIG